MQLNTQLSRVNLPDQTPCSVCYNRQQDSVTLVFGDTSLTVDACSFILMHQAIRKAAAKIIMQPAIDCTKCMLLQQKTVREE